MACSFALLFGKLLRFHGGELVRSVIGFLFACHLIAAKRLQTQSTSKVSENAMCASVSPRSFPDALPMGLLEHFAPPSKIDV